MLGRPVGFPVRTASGLCTAAELVRSLLAPESLLQRCAGTEKRSEPGVLGLWTHRTKLWGRGGGRQAGRSCAGRPESEIPFPAGREGAASSLRGGSPLSVRSQGGRAHIWICGRPRAYWRVCDHHLLSISSHRWAPTVSSPLRTSLERPSTWTTISPQTFRPLPPSWRTSTRVGAGARSCTVRTRPWQCWAWPPATCAQASRAQRRTSPPPTPSWPPGSRWAPTRRPAAGCRPQER